MVVVSIMNRLKDHKAFTMVELLVVVSMGCILITILTLQLVNRRQAGSTRIECGGRLRNLTLSLSVWMGDHNGKLPWETSTNVGGTAEWAAKGIASAHFQVLSNELDIPKLLLCPADKERFCASNFTELNGSNISYFISVDARAKFRNTILSGDRNLSVSGRSVGPGVFTIKSNLDFGWTRDLHINGGNISFWDGRVEFTSANLTAFVVGQELPENRIVIP